MRFTEDVIKNGRSFISPGFCDILNYEVSIEFAVAFGRFGHSMIRREYSKWNTAGKVGNIDNFTEFSYRNREFGRPLVAVESDWVTSWQYLFPLRNSTGPAYRLILLALVLTSSHVGNAENVFVLR